MSINLLVPFVGNFVSVHCFVCLISAFCQEFSLQKALVINTSCAFVFSSCLCLATSENLRLQLNSVFKHKKFFCCKFNIIGGKQVYIYIYVWLASHHFLFVNISFLQKKNGIYIKKDKCYFVPCCITDAILISS